MLVTGIANLFAAESNSKNGVFGNAMEQTDISLLTCNPRNEIYALYGHTAIRVHDRANNRDFVVNYGVFDFRSDFFVPRFMFGLTDYMMGVCSYKQFCEEWGTGIREQRINMTSEEKAHFLELLDINAQPENVVYRYNYFYDNCATRARNIIYNAFDGAEVKYQTLTEDQRGERSFRQLVRARNKEHLWARLGNDLLLGVKADENTAHGERQFLPDILAADFSTAVVVYPNGTRKPLVVKTIWHPATNKPHETSGNSPPPSQQLPSPMQCAITVLAAIVALCLMEHSVNKCLYPWIDYAVVALYGLPGIILFLMIFSQHPTVSLNLQLLVLNPLWLVLAFPRFKYKYRWHIIVASTICFFLGNAVQSYAEGMNIVAFGLLCVATNNILMTKPQND